MRLRPASLAQTGLISLAVATPALGASSGDTASLAAGAGLGAPGFLAGRSEPLLSPAFHAAITLTVLLTTLIAPPALRLAFQRKESA